jgi:hypothetical protein
MQLGELFWLIVVGIIAITLIVLGGRMMLIKAKNKGDTIAFGIFLIVVGSLILLTIANCILE